MPAHILWDRITRTAQVRRHRQEEERKLDIVKLLMEARSLSYGLQAANDPPPTWEELQRQKKNQGPKRDQVQKARKAYEQMAEMHNKGLSSPHDFMVYMGLASEDGKGQLFEKPQAARVKTSKEYRHERRKEVAAMKNRLMGKLDRMIEKHGDKPIDEILVARYE